MHSIAIIVLNYNTPDLTRKLAHWLRTELEYPEKAVFVVDNGSVPEYEGAELQLPLNLGFTKGMHEGYQFARKCGSFDAFWFLNSDMIFSAEGRDSLKKLAETLFSDESFAQISPVYNSDHPHMRQAASAAQVVPWLEPTCTLIKASTIEKVGFWDLDFTLGWGVDYDYGYRIRQAGLHSVLTNRVELHHLSKASQTDRNAYGRNAQLEMDTVMARKYGRDWIRITKVNPSLIVSPNALAICAIFRNEALYLREWVEFHLMMGVTRFFLYQNRSTDNYKAVLRPYIERGLVELIEWPMAGPTQMAAYTDCLRKHQGEHLWLAFIDIDEFLFSPQYSTLPPAMERLKPEWGAVGVNWVYFGASGREEYSSEPVLERFTWRLPNTNDNGRHIKSILRMDKQCVSGQNAHFFNVQGGTFGEEGEKITSARTVIHHSSLLRINHYGTKSRQEYYKRIALGRVDGLGVVSRTMFEDRQARDIDDRTIQQFLPALKVRLS
jgi:GT2 family glycosyltransferase